ncbi:hypothetical protein DBR40_19900 [Pedobacter sp. KBW01]|uniref:hypothetical protein n=1 Tax=Pedobacter sp. KBW01 TaxID=2153364 RepID=UPI000F5AD3BC|nr:hypothetical protein [Pedobacter sp. KBW01]RQO68507.1 hypothetical protein DBR40_19900 [Pedobacter sp. KBW01]
MFKFIATNLTATNFALLAFGKSVPIVQIVNTKMVVDIANALITAVVTIAVAYITAKFQKKDKV